MDFLKNAVLSFISNHLDTSNLIRISGQSIIFPFYHAVSDEKLPHISPLYKHKNVQSFQEDIDFLLAHFEPVSLNDFYLHLQGEKIITKPSFHLSFDDGLREVHDIILPILHRKGIPATVFINSAFVDNKDLFYRYKAALVVDRLNHISISRTLKQEIEKLLSEINLPANGTLQSGILKINYLQKEQIDKIASLLELDFLVFLQNKKPYLNSDELKGLQTKGFTIGGHSIDHPLYADLDEETQIVQTLKSCEYVKSNFSEKISCFSFPFSAQGIGDSFFSKISDSVDITFGISGINTSHKGKHIERIWMESYAENAKECIKKAYLVNILKNGLNKNKKT